MECYAQFIKDNSDYISNWNVLVTIAYTIYVFYFLTVTKEKAKPLIRKNKNGIITLLKKSGED